MANDFYTHGTYPVASTSVTSATMRAEFDLVTLAFDKFPALQVSSANKPLIVNGSGTGVTTTTGALVLAGDFTTTGAFNTTFTQRANVTLTLPAASCPLTGTVDAFGSGIYGFIMSNSAGADPANDMDIGPGQTIGMTSSNGVYPTSAAETITLASSLTKQVDATWAAGTNQGGAASGSSITGTYYVFAVNVNGAADIMFDSSSVGANVFNTSGLTSARKIGAMSKISSAYVVPFIQHGMFFFASNLVVTSTISNSSTFANFSSVSPSGASVPNFLGRHGEWIGCIQLTDLTPAGTVYAFFSSTDHGAASVTNQDVCTTTARTKGSSGVKLVRGNPTVTGLFGGRMSSAISDVTLRGLTYGWTFNRTLNS